MTHMNSALMLYPSIAMAMLTLGMLLRMGYLRYRAIHAGRVRISYYRCYNEGQQPPDLHLIMRHVQNHFEVPPLFHAVVIATFASGTVTPLALMLAWLYVAARCAHSYIHLGSNNVSHRFFVFGFSLLVLIGLWAHLLVALLHRS